MSGIKYHSNSCYKPSILESDRYFKNNDFVIYSCVGDVPGCSLSRFSEKVSKFHRKTSLPEIA